MSYAEIIRGATSDEGTSGRLLYRGRRAGILELPERGNAPGLSCIPTGEYQVTWSYSPHLRKFTYEILKVPGRGGIRLHSGNFAGDVTKGYQSDSLGCPLPCRYFSSIRGQLAGLGSRSIVSDIELVFNRKPFELRIKWI